MSTPKRLDDNGRCCGRKPLVYKRPKLHYFCDRCDRDFDADGRQIANWAWRAVDDGFVKVYANQTDNAARAAGGDS